MKNAPRNCKCSGSVRKGVFDLKDNWGGLFNQKRFKWMAEKKLKHLKNLTI